MCYLSTLVQTFSLKKNTNNLLKNTELLVSCKSREFSRKSQIFHSNFRIFIGKNQNKFEFFKKLFQKYRSKSKSEKLTIFMHFTRTAQKMNKFSDNFSKKFSGFRKNSQFFRSIFRDFYTRQEKFLGNKIFSDKCRIF